MSNDQLTLSTCLNKFAFRLYGQLSKGKNENFFISPYSITAALSMCLVGAREETANELKKLLFLDEIKHEDINELVANSKSVLKKLNSDLTINTANRVYINEGFSVQKQFLDILGKYFSSESQQLNFGNSSESAEIINSWVKEQTKEKIDHLIDENMIDNRTRLLLVNAIYFKGDWQDKFDSALTSKEDFHLSDGSKTKVDMMQLTTKKFQVAVNPNEIPATICSFPYAGNSVAMTIILPNEEVSLETIEEKLKGSCLLETIKSYVMEATVFAYIPKFKLKYKKELSEDLIAMGASIPFDENKANFSAINEQEKLHISKVVHEAVVEVNEEGTEAAAATGVGISLMCLSPEIEFRCNRPFIFMIHEKITNGILFMGKYTKPE